MTAPVSMPTVCHVSVGASISLGSACRDRPRVADEKQLVRTVVVPAGAEPLDVSIGDTSDTAADLRRDR